LPAPAYGNAPDDGITPPKLPDIDPYPDARTRPSRVSVIIGGEVFVAGYVINGAAEVMASAVASGGAFEFATLPEGTDITKLEVIFALPAGATIDPPNKSPQDFSGGPVTYTVTAADRYTKRTFDVSVAGFTAPPTEPPTTPPTEPPTTPPGGGNGAQGSSSGGGCNAPAFGVLALGALALLKKK
jgi:hypothetical protein